MFSCLKSSGLNYTPLHGKKLSLRQSFYLGFTLILQLWREALIAFLCVLCAFLIFELTSRPFSEEDRIPVQGYHLVSADTRWKQFQWNTGIYSSASSEDEEIVNASWDAIVPAYGIVAVDHEWAEERKLPDSMSLPSDSSKGVYIIDAYHQLHCLIIIRKTLIEVTSGQHPSKPIEHSSHCFDSLLQYIVCGTSGDTLLYTWGRNETGNGQLRKCVDWNSRRKWAKENTACYEDGDHPIPLYDHFDHCENGDDGISGAW